MNAFIREWRFTGNLSVNNQSYCIVRNFCADMNDARLESLFQNILPSLSHF